MSDGHYAFIRAAEEKLGITLPSRDIVNYYTVQYGRKGEVRILITDIMKHMDIYDKNYFRNLGFTIKQNSIYMELYLTLVDVSRQVDYKISSLYQ